MQKVAVLINVKSRKEESKKKKPILLIRFVVSVGNPKNDLGPMSCNSTSSFLKVQPQKSTVFLTFFPVVHQTML